MTTGAFYGYYKSKEELFEALTGEHYKYLLDCFKKAQKDFADLQENGLANEFFAAEHQYIAMVKELQEQFLEGSAVETSFLEG